MLTRLMAGLRRLAAWLGRCTTRPAATEADLPKPGSRSEECRLTPANPPPQRDWTLSALLDRLDAEHDRFNVRRRQLLSSFSKSDMRAIERIGAHVFPPRSDSRFRVDDECFDVSDMNVNGYSPTIMHVGFAFPERTKTDDWFGLVAAFAIRGSQSTPAMVSPTPGIPYAVGLVLQTNSEQLCLGGYVFKDDAACRLRVPRVRAAEAVAVPHTPIRYTRQSWKVPRFIDHECGLVRDNSILSSLSLDDLNARLLAAVFRVLLETWRARTEMIQVATRRGRSRVTFCVPPGDQVRAFRDRDRSAIARDGKRKRIVHFVRPHVRSNGQQVPAHLRGVRQFRWNDYDVSIVFPRFHLATFDFDVQPEDWQEGTPLPHGSMSLPQVAGLMRRLEDDREYRHGRVST